MYEERRVIRSAHGHCAHYGPLIDTRIKTAQQIKLYRRAHLHLSILSPKKVARIRRSTVEGRWLLQAITRVYIQPSSRTDEARARFTRAGRRRNVRHACTYNTTPLNLARSVPGNNGARSLAAAGRVHCSAAHADRRIGAIYGARVAARHCDPCDETAIKAHTRGYFIYTHTRQSAAKIFVSISGLRCSVVHVHAALKEMKNRLLSSYPLTREQSAAIKRLKEKIRRSAGITRQGALRTACIPQHRVTI